MIAETPQQGALRILGRIFRRGWPYRWLILAAFMASLANAALLGYLIVVIERLISAWSQVQAADGSGSDAVQQAIAASVDLAWLVAALAPCMAAAAWASQYASQRVANVCMRDLRQSFLEHLVRLDLGFHSQAGRGDLMTRMSADLDGVYSLQSRLYGKFLQRPLEILAVLGWIIYMDPILGLLVTIALIPVALVLIFVLGRMRRRARGARLALAENFTAFEQITSGIRVIKAMGSAERERDRFATTNGQLFQRNMRVAHARGQSDAVSMGSAYLLIAGALGLGAWLFGHDLVAPSALIALIAGLGRLTNSLRELQRNWGDILEQMPAAERVFEILDRQPTIQDAVDAQPCLVPQHGITLSGVRFAYASDEDVLRGIDLHIPVGSTVALVGSSGGGKSTLLDLIPRLHDVTQGSLCWDGIDVRQLQHRSVIQHCAIVQQDPFLFDDTVFENIRYGRPEATREEVEEAARRAHVHDDILRLEGGLGYQTRVGDRGSRLSGGQRQRVSIARALLRDAPVLLMDEPTSALDAESEAHVQAAIAELMRGRTTVIIAHRLATIRHATQICVLAGKDDPQQRGTILERGTHQELIAQGGFYASMVHGQSLAG